jgi:hypothetical protein
MQQPRGTFLRFILTAALALSSTAARAQEPTATEILTQVVQHNAQRQALLSAYTSTRTYSVAYTGIGGPRNAQLIVRAEFHAGEKTFTILSESGSKMICNRVLRKLVESEQEASNQSSRMQSMLSPDNYDATLVGRERFDGPNGPASMDAWVLDVAPKVPTKFTYSGRIWVSVDDDAVVRIQGSPAKNPSFWLTQSTLDSRFRQIGVLWLPSSNTSVSHIRLGGEARLTIDYGDYTVEPRPQLAQAAHITTTASR